MNTKLTALAKSISQQEEQPLPPCYLIKMHDTHHERNRTFLVPSTTVSDQKEFRKVLINAGISITTIQDELQEFYHSLGEVKRKVLTTDISGWIENDYINNQGISLTSTSIYGPRLHPASEVKQFDQSERGTLEEWQQHVCTYAKYSSRLMLGLCSALAGVLIKFTDIENGGFHLHGDSSMGKSTMLKFAASLRGNKDGICNWNITAAALEQVAMAHNDSTLLLDELRLLNDNIRQAAMKAGTYIYMITEGKGKGRSSYFQKNELTWRLIFLSAGELSLSEHAEAGDTTRMNGECVRTIDIPADAGTGLGIYEYLPKDIKTPNKLAILLANNMNQYYGTAIPEFVKMISSILKKSEESEFRATILKHVDHFIRASKEVSDGQSIRIVTKFALLYAAGCLASRFKIVPLTRNEILHGILKCYKDAQSSRPKSTGQKVTDLKQFIITELNSKNAPNLKSTNLSASELNDALVIIATLDKVKVIAIQKEHFQNMFNSSNEANIALNMLDNEGLLLRDAQNNKTRQLTTCNKEHLARRYCIRYVALMA